MNHHRKISFHSLVKLVPDLSKRLKNPSEHFFSDVEVQRAHIQPHRTRTAFLKIIGSSCSSVLLCLQLHVQCMNVSNTGIFMEKKSRMVCVNLAKKCVRQAFFLWFGAYSVFCYWSNNLHRWCANKSPTWEAWTIMGTPKSLWPVNPIASGTEEDSTNSMYAMPFDLLEFLSEIILTSRTYSGKQWFRP